jgi:hypothetical protein
MLADCTSGRARAILADVSAASSPTERCAYCARELPVAQLDLAPNGHRCARCKAQHDIRVLRGGDEQRDLLDAASMRAKASRLGTVFALLVVGTIGAALLLAFFGGDVETGRRVIDDNPLLVTEEVTYRRNPIDRLLYVIPLGVGLAIWNFRAWRRATRTADDMARADGDAAPLA